jgi:uncharacterized protein YcfL
MKKRIILSTLVLSALSFSGCSNVEYVGFDEDSVFYSKPQPTKTKEISTKEPQKTEAQTQNTPQTQDEDSEDDTTFTYELDDGE